MRLLLPLLLLAASSLRASPLDDFKGRVRPELIKPFALDLGGLLGGASAHQGRTIGFPGVWAGVVGAVQSHPDKDDQILRNGGTKAFGLPMVEVGVGLPFRFDVIAHGVSAYGVKVFGGGLRYGVLRPMKGVSLAIPSLSVAAFGDTVRHSYFKAAHFGLDAAASWDLPIVKPVVVAGYDVTKLTVGAADIPGVAGMSATARGTRLSGGAEVSPLPFLRLRGLYTLRHGVPGFDFGLGVSF